MYTKQKKGKTKQDIVRVRVVQSWVKMRPSEQATSIESPEKVGCMVVGGPCSTEAHDGRSDEGQAQAASHPVKCCAVLLVVFL